MKNTSKIVLLFAGILLTLVGCQKGNQNEKLDGKLVQFSAVSGTPGTRTEYSGEGEEDESGKLIWERINWKDTDKLLIWSDLAVVKGEPVTSTNRSTVYGLKNIDNTANNGKESHAYLDKLDDKGLMFPEGVAGPYTFWGMYPENAYKGTKPTEGVVTYEILDAQDGTKTTGTDGSTVFTPDMSKAVMFAYAQVPDVQVVELKFEPAYTAFEFHLMYEAYKEGAAPITLDKVELTSTKSNLAGLVSATIGATKSFEAVVDEANGIAPVNTITYTFPANTTLSQDKPVVFTVFALPNLVEDLRVSFYYKDSSSSIDDIRSGVLSYNKEALQFAACKKHVLKGIFVRENYDANGLKFYFEPMWERKDLDAGSNGNYPQSTQFVVGPSTVVQNAWSERLMTQIGVQDPDNLTSAEKKVRDASRQTWEFLNDGTATVTYSIMLPKAGSWRVEVCGDSGAFTVSPTSGNLAGASANSTKITLNITPKGNANGTLYLKTFVTPTDGNEYSLDSETQLYDLRGYHKFVYNTTHTYTSTYTE